MTHSDIKTKFLIEYDKANITSSYPSLTDYEIATILDKAYNAIIAQKLTGNNPRQIGFEGDNKAIEDIQPLISTSSLNTQSFGTYCENCVVYEKPEDFLYYIQGRLQLSYTKNNNTIYNLQNVQLVTHNIASKFMCTSTNKPWVEKPVCYMENDEIIVLFDPVLHIPGKFDLTRIKKFKPFSLPQQQFDFGTTEFELSDSMAEELINLAIIMCGEIVESQRYQTKTSIRPLES